MGMNKGEIRRLAKIADDLNIITNIGTVCWEFS